MMNDLQTDISKIANDLGIPVFARYAEYIKAGQPFEKNLLDLLKEQAIEAENTRIKRRIRYSGFPIVKTLDTFELSPERFPGLDMNEFNELATCRFIEEKADVVALGPPGVGYVKMTIM